MSIVRVPGGETPLCQAPFPQIHLGWATGGMGSKAGTAVSGSCRERRVHVNWRLFSPRVGDWHRRGELIAGDTHDQGWRLGTFPVMLRRKATFIARNVAQG